MSRRFQTTYGRFGASEDAASTSTSTSTTATTAAATPAADPASSTAKTTGFQWTPEAQEGAIALLSSGVKLTQTVAQSAALKRAAAASAAAAQATIATPIKKKKKKAKAPAAAPPPETSAISTQTILLGVGAFAVVAGAFLYVRSQKKSGAPAGTA